MHKMEEKRQTESVLAKLMGLERPLPSKQLRYGRLRVLSESYLQDISLIGQRQKWSFDRFSLDADNTIQSFSSSEEFHEGSRLEEDKLFQKLWLISSIQKADNEYPSRVGSYLQKVKSPNKRESVAQTPVRGMLQNENVGRTKTSSSVRRKKGTCLGKRERDHLLGIEALRHGSTSTHGAAKQVANELQRSAWHDYLNAVKARDAKGSQSPCVLDTELEKLNSFPRNMNTSSSKVGSGQIISNSTSITSSGSSKFRHRNFSVHKDWCLNLVNGGSSYCNRSQEVCCKSEEDSTPRNSTSIGNLQSENDVSCEETPSTPSGFSEFGQSNLFEDTPAVPLSPKEISSCSDVEAPLTNKECVSFDALSQQVVEDAFMPFHQADNGSPLNQTEAYKPHPDPASNMKDVSLAANSHGSAVKLQQSTTNFFHPEAKRRKSIEVKDVKEGHHNNYSEEILPGAYKTEEIQVLSYLVDILAESGLQCRNLEMLYKLGQPSEYPINPFVFDSLEKKYSKQPSWLRSDRKLLFDRIKCALSDILRPYMGISTRRKHRKNKLALLQGNQDTIKQELLAVLVNQEKEAKREPSDKAIGIDRDWLELELEEDTHIVVKEIEEMLIDELMEEIIST